jgi:hypothetical protein
MKCSAMPPGTATPSMSFGEEISQAQYAISIVAKGLMMAPDPVNGSSTGALSYRGPGSPPTSAAVRR